MTAPACAIGPTIDIPVLIASYDKRRGAGYLNRLRSEDLEGEDVGKWRQLAPLVFYSATLDCFVITPMGFVANSYSVPPLCDWIVRGQDRRPAFTHDDSYDGTILVCRDASEPLQAIEITREQADALILEACASVGMSWWRRRVIFRGTRIGGWAFFQGKPAAAAPVELDPYESMKGE